MRRSSTTTLADIAREAGVSSMTVSAVLNGARTSTRVSQATRERVMEAAERLSYRPNAAARGLQRRRMDVLGVVAVMDYGPNADLNLYFLEVLNGIMAEATLRGQNTMVLSIQDWNADSQRVLDFCDGRVDGLILIGPTVTPEFAEKLSRQSVFVAIHGYALPDDIWNLDVDNTDGARLAVRMLIEQGHRRILHITGSLESGGARERVEGYRRALEEAGIPYDEALVVPGFYSKPAGEWRMSQILESGRLGPLPTAIFAGSDAIAIGCCRALTAYGLHVPEDVSIVGFDDTLDARMNDPPLTTVRQPFREFGHQAVDLLLKQIEGHTEPDSDPPSRETRESQSHIISLAVEPIRRASIAAPRSEPLLPPYNRRRQPGETQSL